MRFPTHIFIIVRDYSSIPLAPSVSDLSKGSSVSTIYWVLDLTSETEVLLVLGMVL